MEQRPVLGKYVFTESGWFIGYVSNAYVGADGKTYLILYSPYVAGQQFQIPIDFVKAIGDVILVYTDALASYLNVKFREPLPIDIAYMRNKSAYTSLGRAIGIVYDEYDYGGERYIRGVGPGHYALVPLGNVASVGDIVVLNVGDVSLIPLTQAVRGQEGVPTPQPVGVTLGEGGELFNAVAGRFFHIFILGVVSVLAFSILMLAIPISTRSFGNVPLVYVYNLAPMLVTIILSIVLSIYSYYIKQSIQRRELSYAIRDSRILVILAAASSIFAASYFIAHDIWLIVPSLYSMPIVSAPVDAALAIYIIVLLASYLSYVKLNELVAKYRA